MVYISKKTNFCDDNTPYHLSRTLQPPNEGDNDIKNGDSLIILKILINFIDIIFIIIFMYINKSMNDHKNIFILMYCFVKGWIKMD